MKTRHIKVLGVPIDLGGAHRGVDMGPNALRVARLIEGLRDMGHRVTDLGNVHVPTPQSRTPGDPRARFLSEIATACHEVAETVAREYELGEGMVVLGGDHSAAVGSVSGLAARHRERSERLGMIWVDAHTDMNTPETSPSGNIHGMPVATLLGHGPRELTHLMGAPPKILPANLVFVAIRSVDPGERELVRSCGATVYTMREVDELGIRRVMLQAIEKACEGTIGFHLSFDMDAVDATVAPGVGTPVRGGLTYREAHLLAEVAADSGRMTSMDLMEVDPAADTRNQTARLGAELIWSAFGKTIL